MTKMDHTQEGEKWGMDIQSLQYMGSLWSMLSPWKILIFSIDSLLGLFTKLLKVFFSFNMVITMMPMTMKIVIMQIERVEH